ncbi:hypothetical protein [Bacillus toyonensis]|uniref:hypothetical protein n=1 Tax=Bacillus toyonensis TaxID=155322 RepID=UPI000BF6AF27|nr:hypothetical protein [Bacillus toyonensis]PGF05195.1 hypothetical protein COM61_01885 [Bacillus toyonensis]
MEDLNFDFLKELSTLHNEIVLGRKQDSEFHSFILANKERFNNLEYLSVAMERFELSEEYIHQNFESCKFVYDFMQENRFSALNTTGLRTGIRLGMFEDFVEDIMKQER